MVQDVPEKAISEVRVSTSQVSSGSDLPREKVELAFKLLEVGSRICRVLKYRSSSVLIFLFFFCRKHWGGRVAKPRMIQS